MKCDKAQTKWAMDWTPFLSLGAAEIAIELLVVEMITISE